MSSGTWNPVRLTAFHRKHLALKAKIVENEGWLRPEYYHDKVTEIARTMGSVGICDISPVVKIDVKGVEVEAFLGKNFPDVPIPKLPGEVTRIRNDRAEKNRFQIEYVCRLTKDQAFIVGLPVSDTPSVLGVDREIIQENIDEVYTTNVTSVSAALSLTGPDSIRVLNKLTQLNLSSESFPNPSCAQAGLAKVQALIVRSDPPDKSGNNVPSFDLYFGRDYGEYVWDAVMDAGMEFDINHFGLRAYNEIFHSTSKKSSTVTNL